MTVSAPLKIPLASFRAKSTLALDTRLINAYGKVDGKGEGARAAAYGTAGLTQFATGLNSTGGASRGMLDLGTELLSVNGQDLYSVNSAGTVTSKGTVLGAKMARMVRNSAGTTQTVIVGDALYSYEAGTLSAFADTDVFGSIIDAEWIKGYMVLADASGRFQWTGLNDLTIDPLSFATAESNPDGLTGVRKFREELYFFGTKTIEVWSLTGDANNPFQLLPGAVIPGGCASRDTIVEVGKPSTLYWLDPEGLVVRLAQGYTTQSVSEQGVYDAVLSVSDKTTIRAYEDTQGSHNFYVLWHSTFCWALDVDTGLWHERKSLNSETWRVNSTETAFNFLLAGSTDDAGVIYKIDETKYAEGEVEFVSLFRFESMDTFKNGATISMLDLQFQTGVGDATSSESDTVSPHLTLRWSDDGAKTWKGGRILSLGAQGRYRTRVRTTRLGKLGSKGRIFEITISSKVQRALIGASINTEELDLG